MTEEVPCTRKEAGRAWDAPGSGLEVRHAIRIAMRQVSAAAITARSHPLYPMYSGIHAGRGPAAYFLPIVREKKIATTPCLAPGALPQSAKAHNISATSDFAGRHPQADRPHPRCAAQLARRR